MTPSRQRTLAALFGLSLALCAGSAHAEEGPDASVKTPAWLAPHSEKPHAAASGPSLGLGRSLGVLLLTSLLGGCALYLRSQKGKLPKSKLAPQLRVISSTKLGGRAQLVLAEVAGRKILLGVTDGSVNKLAWLEPDAEAEEELALTAAQPRYVAAGVDLAARTRSDTAPAAPAKRSFRELVAAAVGNLGRPDDDDDDDSAASSIAAETRDTFTRSAPRPTDIRTAQVGRKAGPQMLNVEGQARGLVARLREPRA